MLLLKAAVVVAILCAFGLAAGRAWDYQQSRYAEIESRVVELEVHDCGLRQFEDYSVAFERDDKTRFMCAGIMRGEVRCDRVVDQSGDVFLENCRR